VELANPAVAKDNLDILRLVHLVGGMKASDRLSDGVREVVREDVGKRV